MVMKGIVLDGWSLRRVFDTLKVDLDGWLTSSVFLYSPFFFLVIGAPLVRVANTFPISQTFLF